MEKQEYKSKWDELAREIGAEVPPEIEQREQEVATPPQAASTSGGTEREAMTPPVVLPKKAAVNWDALAGELGLPTPPPEEKPAEAMAEERPRNRETVRREEPQARESQEEIVKRPERPRREESRGRREERPSREQRHERGEKRERSGPRREQRGERRPPRREPDRDREAYDSERPQREKISRREEERAQAQPEQPAPAAEEPTKPAAVSLWHKIFGAPAPEPAAKFIDQPEVPYTEPPSDYQDEPRDAGGFADAHPDELISDAGDEEFAGEESRARGEDRESSDRQRGGRPHRRRGRGRGRRAESSRGEESNREQRETRPRERERASERDRIVDDGIEDELGIDESAAEMDLDADEGDEMVESGVARGRSALQRTIPSWDEAIGFIVDSNMQTRSERRPPPRSGSRENGGRGRGRGRRRPQ